MPFSTIFQLYRGGKFYWWKKPEYPQVTDNIYSDKQIFAQKNNCKINQTTYCESGTVLI